MKTAEKRRRAAAETGDCVYVEGLEVGASICPRMWVDYFARARAMTSGFDKAVLVMRLFKQRVGNLAICSEFR